MAKIISKIKTSNTEYGIRAGYMYYGLTTGTESALTVTITDESGNTISIPELVKGMTFALTLHVIPSTSATLSVNGLTGKPIQYGTGLTGKEWVVGETYQFVYNGTAYVAMSTYDDYTVTTSGSGNAITSISKSGKTITATKGSTFLTAHPTITKSTDTTSTQSVAHQGSFTVIDSVTRDSNGHVTKVNTKTVTLPSDVGEVNQNAFSNVVVGSTTIAADSKTDSLTLVAGSNITLTPDATNDKITIAATDTNTHYESKNTIGTKSATTNSVQGNGSVYINHIENSKTVTSSHLITGDGGTKVTSDASGNITISSASLATVATSGSYNDLSNKPPSLKNPKSLTIGSKSYDGSTAVSISAQDLGLDSALKYCGVTTTKLTDGATTNPIVINSNDHTATTGCVVFYETKEFVFDGAKWNELGDGSNHKIKQTAVSSPSASGSTTAFIDTISQDANGKITATKKNVTFPTVGDGKVTVNQAGKQIATFTMNQSGDTVIDLTDNNTTYTSLKNPYSLTIQGNSTNIATYDGSSAVTANIPAASTSAYGVTKLTSSTSSTSEALAATAKAVKTAYDLANSKTDNKGTVTKISTGAGLKGGDITTTGTISPNLNSTTSLGTIGTTSKLYAVGVDSNSQLCVNVPWTDNNTDTKVTAVGNHYTPSGGSTATATASGNTLSFGGAVITGVTKDAAGHVTGVTTSKLPANPNTDTHYKSLNIVGASDTATTNAKASNGSVYLNHVENGAVTSKHKITGSGGTTVVSDDSGNITVTSPSLSTSTSSTSTTTAATSSAVKAAYDLANSKTANTGTVTSITPGTGLTGTSSDTAITTSGTINLKTASANEIGGIKIGYTQSGKNYPIQLDSNNKAYVNVPWTDNNTTYSFVNNNPTLAWSTKSTVGTVGGVELTVNMPANPNSDTKVTAVGNHYTPSGGSAATATASGSTLSFGGAVITGVTKDAAGHVTGVTTSKLPANPNSDTKNTAGSTDTSSKIFLIGATSQAANPQTYSHDTAYVGTDGCLYSNNTKVSVDGHTHSYAGSSSAGGAATSAVKLSTARSIAISGGATGTATNFDGTANISIPVTGVSEAYLTWGGKNHAGSYGPIDAAMIPELGANRLAFTPSNKINIEYSQDGGSTWKTYSATNAEKVSLFSVNGAKWFYIGGSSATGVDKSKYKLRVTVNTEGSIYSELNKFMIYCSTNGSSGTYCTISARLQTHVESNTETWKTFANQISILGWSGYNIINTSGITTYGNKKNSQYGQLRFEFGVTTHSSSSQYSGLYIINIYGYGGVGWTCPSTMAKTGHLYSYDASQNATFPAQITATQFNGLATNASRLSNTSAIGSTTQPVYFTANGVPTACTYTLGKSVPSDAVFTDTHYKSLNIVGASATATANATATNGNVFLNHVENGSVTSKHKIVGSGATTVISDSSGNITISSPSVGETNQNAFSNVVVGSTTITANSKTDTLTLVAGSNITLTPDATNDKITIAATDTNTHNLSKNIIGAKNATANSSQVNGSVYLTHIENSEVTSSHQITGGGGTTVKSDSSGNIVISSGTIPSLATVATSGSYNDLSNKPTVGNATVTIKQNNTSKGSFTLNQTSAATINLTDTIFNPSESLRVSGQFLQDPNDELETFTCDGDVENPYVTFSLTDAGEGEKLIHGRQLQLVGESGVNIRGNSEGKIFFNVEGGVGEQGPRGYQGYQGYQGIRGLQGTAGKNGTGTQGYQGYTGADGAALLYINKADNHCYGGYSWDISSTTRSYTAFNGGGTITITSSSTPRNCNEHYLLIHNCGGSEETGVITFSTTIGTLIAKSQTIKVPANSYVEVSVVYIPQANFTGSNKATLVLTCSDVMTKVI